MNCLSVTKQELYDFFGKKLGTIDDNKIMKEITKYTFDEIEEMITESND